MPLLQQLKKQEKKLSKPQSTQVISLLRLRSFKINLQHTMTDLPHFQIQRNMNMSKPLLNY
jgi:hypothetical protein